MAGCHRGTPLPPLAGYRAEQLRARDLLVVITSDTLPTALAGVASDGQHVEVHLPTLGPAAAPGYPAALASTASGGRSEHHRGAPWSRQPTAAQGGPTWS